MAILDVDRRHPLYQEWADAANFLWRSYLGGRAYQDPDAAMLDRYPAELMRVFEARLQRAFYLNYFASTIDGYTSAVYRRDPVREGGEGGETLSAGFQSFIEDATGDGTDLNEFARDIASFALSCERAFVGIDLRVTDGVPYAYMIHPHNLLDFSETLDGSLLWAIVSEEEVVDVDPFVEREVVQRYRLWMPTEWVLFDDDGNELDSGLNRAGRVPIVGVPGSQVRLPVYDIALINKRIYNHCSQLDEIFINATFPTLYYSAEGVTDAESVDLSQDIGAAGDVSNLVLGPTRALGIPTDKDLNVIPPGYLVPPDGPAKLLMDERQRLADTIRSLAGLERRDPDALSPQSGVAKAYDFRETNERFVSLAQVMEEFEVELFSLLNDYGIAGNINVSYNKEFHIKDFTVLVDNYLKLQTATLPAVVKKVAALDISMAIAEEEKPEKQREIQQAVEAMTEFDTPAPGESPNGNGVVATVSPIDQVLARRRNTGVGITPATPGGAEQTEGGA